MKTIIWFKKMALFLALSFGVVTAHSAEISLETDPATFAFGGYAAHVRIQRDGSPWVISVGAYSLEFPEVMRGLVINPSSDHLTLKLKSGFGLFVDRYLSTSKNEGLFVGVQVAHHALELNDNNMAGGPAKYNAVITMPRIGYRWNVGTSGFYLLPWAGAGYVSTDGDDPKIGAQSYSAKQWLPFGSLHLGYQF
jgi:hypothetical protein